jgi:hypothetical protein
MRNEPNPTEHKPGRRDFLKKGVAAAGVATVGSGLLTSRQSAAQFAGGSSLNEGDAAILRFLAALETIEADLWRQYAELGGATTQPGKSKIDLPFTTGLAPNYIVGLIQLDGDMPQYIADNTDDELTHAAFLEAYLAAKGEEFVDLNKSFLNIAPSQVTGVPQTPRLTNLKQLAVDTSWWTRYRSSTQNPDFGDTFPQAVPSLAVGQHPAIPLKDADLLPDPTGPNGISNHLQAIANTAGFHFCFIEQGGSSLYPSLALRVTEPEVLRILLSIGPTETSHFQTWHDKAGNAPAVTDGDLVFTNLNSNPDADDFQTNLIMPEPTIFLSKKFPAVSIIRPTETEGAAMGAVQSFIDDGLFIGQSSAFFRTLKELAREADAARRERQ